MRERLQMIGGKLWLLSKPGRGTELAAEAPTRRTLQAIQSQLDNYLR